MNNSITIRQFSMRKIAFILKPYPFDSKTNYADLPYEVPFLAGWHPPPIFPSCSACPYILVYSRKRGKKHEACALLVPHLPTGDHSSPASPGGPLEIFYSQPTGREIGNKRAKFCTSWQALKHTRSSLQQAQAYRQGCMSAKWFTHPPPRGIRCQLTKMFWRATGFESQGKAF